MKRHRITHCLHVLYGVWYAGEWSKETLAHPNEFRKARLNTTTRDKKEAKADWIDLRHVLNKAPDRLKYRVWVTRTVVDSRDKL